MSRIQLFFKQATEVVGNDDDGILVLTDAFQERQLAIPCDKGDLAEFKSRLDSHGHKQPNKLIDVLWKVIRWQTSLDLEIVISGLDEGHYMSLLSNVDTLDQVSISAPDAVLLSYISKGKIPLYIDESLFLRQSSPFDARAKGVALPVNSLSMSMLHKTLDKAVGSENYELASQLRDEIKKRENARKKTNAGSEGEEEDASEPGDTTI